VMGKPRLAPIRAADAVAATNVWRTDPRHMAMRARILADDLGSGIYPTDWFVDNGITVLVARLLRGTECAELGRKIHTMGRYSEARNEMHQNVASIQRVSLPGFTRKNDTMNMRTIRPEGA